MCRAVTTFGALVGVLVALGCGTGEQAAPVDEQCRDACRAVAPDDCREQCASKCRGSCLSAPSDLHFEFASTTRIACAPDGGAVSFEIERDADPVLMACQ